MKQKQSIIIILALLSLLFSLCGCGRSSEPEMVMPTAFYYHNNLDAKEDFNNVFVAEIREGVQYQNDYILLINSYFAGPELENLVNPFPADLEAVSLRIEADTAYIVLSDQIAKLNSVDLTMACSCLSFTLFELTQCNYVRISAENDLLNNQDAILLSRESMFLLDDTLLPTEN